MGALAGERGLAVGAQDGVQALAEAKALAGLEAVVRAAEAQAEAGKHEAK